MNHFKIFMLINFSILINSCKTTKESTLLGIGIGSIIGSVAGAASTSDKNSNRAYVGAAAGAAVGGLAGFLYKKDKQKELQVKPNKSNLDIPSLTMPKVRRIWVPDQIKGKKLVKGHFIYIIEKEGRWKVEKK